MDQSTVLERLKSVLEEILGERLEGFEPSMTLDALGLDSVDRVELLTQLEEQFDIQISNADAVHLSSVEALVRYVQGRAP
jgi:acyl carrier protein